MHYNSQIESKASKNSAISDEDDSNKDIKDPQAGPTDSVGSTPSVKSHAVLNVVTQNAEDKDAETSTSPHIFTQNNLEEQNDVQAGCDSMTDTQPHRVDKGKGKEDDNLL